MILRVIEDLAASVPGFTSSACACASGVRSSHHPSAVAKMVLHPLYGPEFRGTIHVVRANEVGLIFLDLLCCVIEPRNTQGLLQIVFDACPHDSESSAVFQIYPRC